MARLLEPNYKFLIPIRIQLNTKTQKWCIEASIVLRSNHINTGIQALSGKRGIGIY